MEYLKDATEIKKAIANKTGDEYIYTIVGEAYEIISVHYGKYK